MIDLVAAQEMVLNCLKDKISTFYLGGGTALAKYYLQHRQSYDLDFFTKELDFLWVDKLMHEAAGNMGLSLKQIGKTDKQGMIRIVVYMLVFGDGFELKVDFIEDWLDLRSSARNINGINVFSVEDIYLRKLLAVIGARAEFDDTGRLKHLGGRQEAKDFYDLYFLSQIAMPLAEFVDKYCGPSQKEALVRWFKTYDRLEIKAGLLELLQRKEIDYKKMEAHFKQQVDKVLEKELK